MIERYCAEFGAALAGEPALAGWTSRLEAMTRERLLEHPHGDLPRWLGAVANLPDAEVRRRVLDQDVVGVEGELADEARGQAEQCLRALMPWRKGPFDVLGIHIDAEWRSDRKWGRVLPHIHGLAGRRVLDVGCGSGYHCWRMRGAGAGFVLGIDPTLLYFFQYLAVRRYLADEPVWLAPVRLEELGGEGAHFDTVFSMGVLYHRRSPLDHLRELFEALRPGGQLVLETLVVPGDEYRVLVPRDRYARMRNVFFLPATGLLEIWLGRTGFEDIRLVDLSATGTGEQRTTQWMTFQSLQDFLMPGNPQLTVEGYPAPCRAVLVATRPA